MTLETLKIQFQAETGSLEGKLSSLTGQLDGFSARLTDTIDRAAASGSGLADAFAGGIIGRAASAKQAAGRVANSARFSSSAAIKSARSAGANLTAGFAAGISSKSSAVSSAVRRIVNQATSQMRTLLDIHSPSRVAARFGSYFGEGFALGIQDSVSQVARAASDISAAATGGLSAVLPGNVRNATPTDINAAVNAALGNVNLTIPLNVDGVKLGEASIRGINAVTRSAGRLLLNI